MFNSWLIFLSWGNYSKLFNLTEYYLYIYIYIYIYICRKITPFDFWLFPKLRGCRYETREEMKEAAVNVIDTLTQEDFHWALKKLLERYNKCIAAGGDYFNGD